MTSTHELVPKQAKKPATAAGIPKSKCCTPCGLLNVQMSTIRRPPVCAAFISGHFGILAMESWLDLGLVQRDILILAPDQSRICLFASGYVLAGTTVFIA